MVSYSSNRSALSVIALLAVAVMVSAAAIGIAQGTGGVDPPTKRMGSAADTAGSLNP